MCTPAADRSSRRTGKRCIASLLAAATTAICACATGNDPSYNPYASPRGEPTLLERGDALIDAAADALDDLDERFENAVY